MTKPIVNRRDFLKAGVLGTGALVGLSGATARRRPDRLNQPAPDHHDPGHEDTGTVGEVDLSRFDPFAFLTAFDWGQELVDHDGRSVRLWEVVAIEKEIEVAPGVWFPGWTYNGQVPGPTFRCREGDLLRVNFTNGTTHPHTIHFHGIHPPSMDGVTPIVEPGDSFTYEFEARPFGLHLYHCHVMPLKRHIHKGLYGAFIIDPPGGRPPAYEMVMAMNAFDTNFDGENEVYAVNTVAFLHLRHPIQVSVGQPLRLYLVNMTEFDLLNSFHLHAGMFRLYRTGTRPDQYEYTDTVIMGQGERHILEFTLDYPGQYMFHAHQSEFAELGWIGLFEAVE
ncbi:MAG: multicopper oxidase domain-containing protein [Chloroflexota bacterium]